MRPAEAVPAKARPGGFYFALEWKMDRKEDGGGFAAEEHGWTRIRKTTTEQNGRNRTASSPERGPSS